MLQLNGGLKPQYCDLRRYSVHRIYRKDSTATGYIPDILRRMSSNEFLRPTNLLSLPYYPARGRLDHRCIITDTQLTPGGFFRSKSCVNKFNQLELAGHWSVRFISDSHEKLICLSLNQSLNICGKHRPYIMCRYRVTIFISCCVIGWW